MKWNDMSDQLQSKLVHLENAVTGCINDRVDLHNVTAQIADFRDFLQLAKEEELYNKEAE